jgi:TPR repeat protein
MALGIVSVEEARRIPDAYRHAGQCGIDEAWLKLAWWSVMPMVGETFFAAAEDALRSAVAANAPNAKLEAVKIRWHFLRDTANAEERDETFRLANELARSGNAEGLYYLGLLTCGGFGTEPNPAAAFQLQSKAADLGNTDAMFELYVHYANGLGVAKNDQAALNANLRAAEAGHSRAAYNMGAFYATGRMVEKNMAESVKWYERAADAGNPRAMANLAMIYGAGDGAEKDIEYAQQLLGQAEYLGLDVREMRELLSNRE